MRGRRSLTILLLAFCWVLAFPVCLAEQGTTAEIEQTSLPDKLIVSPTEKSTLQSESTQVPFSPDIIEGVQSATLTYTLLSENREIVHTAELTDVASLADLQALLYESEKLDYETPCFAQDTDNVLTVTLANGTQTSVSVALDSCTIIRSDGAYYNFMPPQYRDNDEHPDNTILYSLFSVSLF